MAENEFVVQRVGHVGNIELILFVAYFGVEKDVEEHVAKLFLYVFLVIVHEGLNQFVDLFYCVRTEAFIGLLGIPRAFDA